MGHARPPRQTHADGGLVVHEVDDGPGTAAFPPMRQWLCHHGANRGKNIVERNKSKPLAPIRSVAILVGMRTKNHESLVAILKAGGFDLVGAVSIIEDITEISIKDDVTLLIVIDSGDKPETTIEQIKIAKVLHPDSRIAVMLGGVLIGGLIPLFQAGAHVCLDRGADPITIRKSLELILRHQ
jgi:hypothetical protein